MSTKWMHPETNFGIIESPVCGQHDRCKLRRHGLRSKMAARCSADNLIRSAASKSAITLVAAPASSACSRRVCIFYPGPHAAIRGIVFARREPFHVARRELAGFGVNGLDRNGYFQHARRFERRHCQTQDFGRAKDPDGRFDEFTAEVFSLKERLPIRTGPAGIAALARQMRLHPRPLMIF